MILKSDEDVGLVILLPHIQNILLILYPEQGSISVELAIAQNSNPIRAYLIIDTLVRTSKVTRETMRLIAYEKLDL